MKIGRKLKIILMGLVLAAIGAFLVYDFWPGRREVAMEKERERHVQAPSRLPVREGESIVTLDPDAKIKSGIVISPLKPIIHQEELQVYGMVLDLQSLIDLRRTLINLRKSLVDSRSGYAAVKAQVDKTRVSLDATGKQYERSKALYEENQNVSAKSFQAVEAAWRSAEADFRAAQEALKASQKAIETAEEALQALIDSARQHWGPVLVTWLSDNTPAFERLVRQQTRLIQITLPSGVKIPAGPQSVQVQTESDMNIAARLVSPSPRTDPRIQGMSFFYLVPAQAALLPGMNVTAYLPVGPKVRGIFIPGSAVVWWQGKAWVFLQKDKTRFVRQEVQTLNSVRDGYLATKGFTTTDRIVVKGAQILLSQEFQPRRQGAGEGDTD